MYFASSLVSAIVGGYIWYNTFDTFNATIAGFFIASIYVLFVYWAEKSMLLSKNYFGIITRFLLITLLVVFSSVAVDVSSRKADVVYKIEKDAGVVNSAYQEEIRNINERYKSEEEEVLKEQLKLSVEQKSTETVNFVIEKMRAEKNRQKSISLENARLRHKVKKPDFSFTSILSVYLDNPKVYRNKYYMYILLFEILPLLIFSGFKLKGTFGG
jgi:hypothetical protein